MAVNSLLHGLKLKVHRLQFSGQLPITNVVPCSKEVVGLNTGLSYICLEFACSSHKHQGNLAIKKVTLLFVLSASLLLCDLPLTGERHHKARRLGFKVLQTACCPSLILDQLKKVIEAYEVDAKTCKTSFVTLHELSMNTGELHLGETDRNKRNVKALCCNCSSSFCRSWG